MTPRAPRGAASRRGDAGRSRFHTVLGIPVPLVLIALAASALLGVLLASALEQSTASRSHTPATSVDSAAGAGKNASGLPVVTEMTLGTEVQRLVDAGTIQPMTSFDAAQCLREQQIQESILIMEEVAWGPEQTPGWLLVHGPMDRETLRANGGVVSTTVVLPECGAANDDSGPDDDRLWSGHVMIGSL